METFSPDTPGLNDLRDVVVKELRELAAAFARDYPDDAVELKGILERGRPLVRRYARRVDALAGVDLDAPVDDEGQRMERLETLLGALHLPRIVESLGAVLSQEGVGQAGALDALRDRAQAAAARLEALTGVWHLLQGGGAEEL